MNKEEANKIIDFNRSFFRNSAHIDGYPSDQELKLPQPPLVKEKMSEEAIQLPTNYEDLHINNNFLDIINNRKSSRVYTSEGMSLLELSYLLWCTQGVKEIRGKAYATLRTVPSAGARHPFETYLYVNKVEGLKKGLYHYLPMSHEIEFLKEVEDSDEWMNKTVHGQRWAVKADVMFYYSFVPYRGEWRYGIGSHRVALMDAGYVSENLYLACASINLGTCAIGGVDPVTDEVIGLDGYNEFVFIAQPVGTIKASDVAKEKAHYKFVEDEGY